MKRNGTDEEMIRWLMERASPPRAASRRMARQHWVAGTERLTQLVAEANRRLAAQHGESLPQAGERVAIDDGGDALSATIQFTTVHGTRVIPQDALNNPKFCKVLEAGDIDLDKFERERLRVNSWDVTVQNADGVPEQRTNHLFEIRWRRKRALPLLEALEALEERLLTAPVPKCEHADRTGDHMVEIALYDLHFGLMAWAAETGEDYDLSIARMVFSDAVAQVLARTEGLDVAYWLMPIGNDFLHVNDLTNVTPRGKNELDVDTRLGKIVEEGGLALRDAIEHLKARAPVKLLWIPGNHDPQTSYFLSRELRAFYHQDARVEVDVSERTRKIEHFGVNLIGFMHGCDVAAARHKALPGLLADEAAEQGNLWQAGQYREIHMGHKHGKGELYFHAASTHGSVVVRVIPSLVGTDFWHYSKGFVHTSKTAQFFVWNSLYGLESVQDVHVDTDRYHDRRRQPDAG